MRRMLIAAVIAALPNFVTAQEAARGPNGGPVVNADGHLIEMVTAGTELTLFLREDGEPIMSAGTKNARAVIQDGGKTQTIQLQPAVPNRLVGTLPQPLGPGARVVVSATLPDGHAVQARFVR